MALTFVTPPRVLMSTAKAAMTLTTNLRAVGESVSDAYTFLKANGRPEGWSGDAADHAMTTISQDVDSAVAALERGSQAVDVYADALVALEKRYDVLVEETSDLNARIELYDKDVRAANATPDTDTSALAARYAALEQETEQLRTRITQWESDCDAAHLQMMLALTAVDSQVEGAYAAQAPDRPDSAALAAELAVKVEAGDAQATNRWWASLSPAAQAALVIHSPQLVGNANGIPSSVRNDANRTSLYSDLDYLGERDADDQLSRNERDQLANARHTRAVLADYKDEFDPVTGEQLALLLAYQPGAFGGNGGVAVNLGNPDLADDVASLVPELTPEQVSLSQNLKSMALLRDAVDGKNGVATVATIAWIDYDAPSGNPFVPDDLLDPLQDAANAAMVGNELLAGGGGGERFADVVDGLRAAHQGPRADLTAIGHSYGSTTVAKATDGGLDVDDIVLAGSPGVGAGNAHATDLLSSGRVWVGSADYDVVTHFGDDSRLGLGNDPAEEQFGGRRFEVEQGEVRPGAVLKNHTSYFARGTTSLDNIADIVSGHDPGRVEGRPVDGVITLPDALDPGVKRARELAEDAYELGRDVAGWGVDRAQDAYELGRAGGSWVVDRARDVTDVLSWRSVMM